MTSRHHRVCGVVGVIGSAALAGVVLADVATWTGSVSSIWNVADNWSSPVFPNNGALTWDVVIDGQGDGPAIVDMTSQTIIDSLSVSSGDQVNITNGDIMFVDVGPILNDGTIRVAGTGGTTRLHLRESMSLDGSGVIELTGLGNTQLRGEAELTRIHNGVDHTLRGAGQIRLLVLDNEGLIESDGGDLRITLSDPPRGTTNTNSGMIRANGATLIIFDTLLDNTGGTIMAMDESEVILQPSEITGGTFATEGSGAIVMPSGPPALIDVTNLGLMRVGNSTDPAMSGVFTNHGVFRLESENSGTFIKILSPTLLIDGDGTIETTNNANGILAETQTERLIHGADHTIRGSLVLQCDVVNNGTIIADLSEGIDLEGVPNVVNHGTIEVRSDGHVGVTGEQFLTTGTVSIDAGTYLERIGDYEQTDGVTDIDGELIAETPSQVVVTGGVVRGNGTIESALFLNDGGVVMPGDDGDAGATLTIDGAYEQTLSGLLEIEGNGTVNDRLLIFGSGQAGIATLGGELRLIYPDGAYSLGDDIVVINAEGIEGGFDCVTGPDEPYDVAYVDGDVIVTLGQSSCVGDAVGVSAGVVDFLDLLAVLNSWNQVASCTSGDINSDGVVNLTDLILVLANWGPCE